MAKPTFDGLKAEVAMRAEESGVVPNVINLGGVQYTLDVPPELKVDMMGAVRNPARLDDLLDRVAFVGTDGTRIQG